jgi:hypothetical protein
MTISKGDRVKFLNDTGGGIVMEIRDSKMAIVLIDDGFEVPVPVSELIPVAGSSGYQAGPDKPDQFPGRKYAGEDDKPGFREKPAAGPGSGKEPGDYAGDDPYGHESLDAGAYSHEDPADRYSGETGRQPPAGKPARRRPERNLLLGLVGNTGQNSLDLWLINDSGFDVFFTVLRKDESSWLNIRAGHIDPDTKIIIRSFSREQVNTFLALRLQALFYTGGLFDPVPPAQADFSIDPLEVYADGALDVNEFFEENAMIMPLISDSHDRETRKMREQEIGRLIINKKEGPQPSSVPERSATDPLVEEVDLHIEELVENHSGLSGREVLDLQMARFTTALEGALRGKTRRIVFIHGVGGGKLKFEIRKTLDRKYPRLRYQDASFQEYGYGATMVILRK